MISRPIVTGVLALVALDLLMGQAPRTGTGPGTLVNSKDGLTYVWVAPGNFMMGCSEKDRECDYEERPAHEVTITKGFWMGQTEVTQAAYQKVMEGNPSYFQGEKRPVDQITWNEAKRYCTAIGGRLPTEAEWEYAARAGTTGARYGDLEKITWCCSAALLTTHEVKGRRPNGFGLYDVLGNVAEWTADHYEEYAADNATDPRGPGSPEEESGVRVRRGGARSARNTLRASFREGAATGYRFSVTGVRCVLALP